MKENINQICKDGCSGKQFVFRIVAIQKEIVYCCERGFAMVYEEAFGAKWNYKKVEEHNERTNTRV